MQNSSPVMNRRAVSVKNHLCLSTLQEMGDPLNMLAGARSANYEIIYLQTGSGKLVVNLQQSELDIDHIYFISPGQVRSIELAENTSGIYLSVSPDFFLASDNQLPFVNMLRQYRGLGNVMTMQVDYSNRKEIEDIFLKMDREMNADHDLQFEMLQVYFRTFLLYICKADVACRQINTGSNDMRIAKIFMQMVNNQFVQKKMVCEYADELCVTRSYLNKVVKRVSGFTASQIIQQRIIQEAKTQAIKSGTSMKQIAYSLGFDDSAHFSKFFKSNCGINFTNYKRELGCGYLI